jgi:hypothetical protein
VSGRFALGVASAALLSQAAAAQQTSVGVDVSTAASASSNPFLSTTGQSTATASATIGITPRVTITEARSQLSLTGNVAITEYLRNFGRTNGFRLSADGSWQPDARLTIQAGLGYAESNVGESNFTDFPIAPTPTPQPGAPGQAPDPVIVPPVFQDPSVLGVQSRRRSFNTSLSFGYQPDARQRFNLSYYAGKSSFSRLLTGNDYVSYGQMITYDRFFGRGSIGLSFGLDRYECRSGDACYAVTASPQITGSMRLGASWTLSGSAGVSISKLRYPLERSTTVSPAGSVAICRKDSRTDFCLTGSQSVQATATNGAGSVISVGVSSGYRLTSRDRISLSGNYTTSTQTLSILSQSFEFYTARLTATHDFNGRASLVAIGGYSNSANSFLGRRTNLEVSLGLRWSFGRNI